MKFIRRLVALFIVSLSGTFLPACGDSDSQESTSTTQGSATSDTDPQHTVTTESTVTNSATSSTLPSADPLVLYGNGIGAERLGARADHVVETLTALLGSPSDDRFETAFSSSYGVCPGNEIRVVEWGGFALLFTDGETQFAPARVEFTFFDWRIRDLGDATPPLATLNGTQVGDTTSDLKSAEGSAVEVFEDEWLGPAFRIGDDETAIRGALTNTGANGTIVSMAAGSSCGE